MKEFQRTIKKPFTLSGVGVHTGISANLTVRPAQGNHGYVFKRVDLENEPTIKADVDFVTDVSRGTTLTQNGAKVMTVEHLLAALIGSEIDNVLIELDGPEVPILDGSSRMFVDAIVDSGIELQNEFPRESFRLNKIIAFRDEARNVELVAMPADDYQLSVMIDYNSEVLGPQHATVDHINDFRKEIAEARTFCFLHEIEHLVDSNLIRGGSLDNALVIVDHKIEDSQLRKLAQFFQKDDIEVEEGYLNNVEL